MRAYLLITGGIFGIITMLHVWRMIAEWPGSGASASFLLTRGALILIPGALAWWAWRLRRAKPAGGSQPIH